MAVSKTKSIREITSFFQSGMTHDQISSMVQCKNPPARGLSPRSIRCFCQINNLGRYCKLSRKEIRKVYQRVSEVF